MTPIEIAARAMAKVAMINPDIGWRVYAPHVRAAFLAVREPTEDMISFDGHANRHRNSDTWASMVDVMLGHGR